MSTIMWNIKEFYGVDQSKDGSFLNEGTAVDSRNMDTSDGNLRVAAGYVPHINNPIPGTGPVRRLAIMKMYNELIFVGIAGDEEGNISLYSYDNTPGGYGWVNGFTYPSEVIGRYWDTLQCNIGDTDYMIFANGEHQMIKWDLVHNQAELFGSGETVLETTVASYSAPTVILADEITDLAKTRLTQAGIVIKDLTYKVKEVDQEAKSVTLDNSTTLPGTPAAGNEVKIKGGISDAKVNYIAMHFSRLFAAGDPENPARLYYSQIPGDGRSIEDWSPDEASANSGGGFIEVGNSKGDPIVGLKSMSTQLLIFKRYTIYRLLGDRPSNFTVERVEAEVERVTHTAVAMHADIAFYLTPSGLYYFNNVTSQPMPDMRNLKNFMKDTLVSQCKACENNDFIYFTCYKGDNPNRDYDNHIIVYDMTRRCYLLRDGFDVSDINAIDGIIYALLPDRKIYRLNEGETYNGKPIKAYWHTQMTDLGRKSVYKKVSEIALRAIGKSFQLITRFGSREYIHDQNITTDNMIEIVPITDWDRTFQFKLENAGGSFFEIQGGVEAYVETEDRPRK